MCGLVGLAGDCSMKMKDVFTELLFVDTFRGGHSTGAALIRRDKDELLLLKAPIPGPMFVALDPYKKLMNQVGIKVMIGHNRYATVGEKNEANAHPFGFENIVGAHNGTLDRDTLRDLEDYSTFGTDSEALYNSVDKYGLKPTLEKLTGAWALTFFNKADNTINLIRNSKRPLYYAYTDDLCTLVWASEADMLTWVVGRNNFKLYNNEIFECSQDTHYKWKVPEYLNDKFDKPVVSKIEGKKWVYQAPTKYYSSQTEFWYENGNHHQQQTGVTSNSVKSVAKTPDPVQRPKIDTKKFRPPYKDAYGKVMSKSQFLDLCKPGCLYCDNFNQSPQKWGDFIYPLKLDMDGRKTFLCEDCYNDDDIRELIEATI